MSSKPSRVESSVSDRLEPIVTCRHLAHQDDQIVGELRDHRLK